MTCNILYPFSPRPNGQQGKGSNPTIGQTHTITLTHKRSPPRALTAQRHGAARRKGQKWVNSKLNIMSYQDHTPNIFRIPSLSTPPSPSHRAPTAGRQDPITWRQRRTPPKLPTMGDIPTLCVQIRPPSAWMDGVGGGGASEPRHERYWLYVRPKGVQRRASRESLQVNVAPHAGGGGGRGRLLKVVVRPTHFGRSKACGNDLVSLLFIP